MKHLLLALLTLFFLTTLFAQPGTLDNSFGINGKILVDFKKTREYYSAIGLQSDNKIVAAGTLKNSNKGFIVSRFLNDGTIDKTFGNNGSVTLTFTGNSDVVTSLVIQKDDKIILAGYGNTSDSGLDASIIRLYPNGLIESAFGSGGKSKLNFKENDVANAVALQSDGKIVIGGTAFQNFLVARFNTNGSIDSTFNTNGYNISTFPNTLSSYGWALKIQDDNKIVLAGYTGTDFAVARFQPNGILDFSFGNSGMVETDLGSFSTARCINIFKNGKILVAGNYDFVFDSDVDVALVLYNTDGSVDSTFGMNGSKFIDFIDNEKVHSSISQDDGKIVYAGNYLFRVLPNGDLDTSFGEEGRLELYNYHDYGESTVFLQPDNKILIAGATYINNQYDCSISRYNNDVVLPINLLSFTATKKQTSVLLNWQTAVETNNNYFSIERSNNSNANFKEIGRVNSKDNFSQIQQYSFEDIAPLNGVNYYRLKQVNKDGSATTSKIALVDFTKDAIIKLYPNPVKSTINIDGLSGTTTLSIIDVNGKVLATTKTMNNNYNWNIKTLPPGNYYLRIDAGKKITTIKFVKQ